MINILILTDHSSEIGGLIQSACKGKTLVTTKKINTPPAEELGEELANYELAKYQLIILDCQFQEIVIEKVRAIRTDAILLYRWVDIHLDMLARANNARSWNEPAEILHYINKIHRAKDGINIVAPHILTPKERSTKYVLKDPKNKEMASRIFHAAKTDSPVLITGDTGTGKNETAKFIHDHSARANNTFLVVNCTAIGSDLFEAAMFGAKKGSFTGSTSDQIGFFEAANGGTLVLDEIGDIDTRNQVKLLQAIQDQKIKRIGESKDRPLDTRIILATNRNIEAEISAGRFREDLYHRVKNNRIILNPLAVRRQDIYPTIQLALLAHPQKTAINLQPEALDYLLEEYTWPGNLRQLTNSITTIANYFSPNELITLEEIYAILNEESYESECTHYFSISRPMTLSELKSAYIKFLESKEGTPKAAEILRINKRTIQRRKK